MIDRRSQGTLNLHAFLLGAEAVSIWFALEGLSLGGLLPGITYYSLLPKAAYPGAIVAGMALALRYLWRAEDRLAAIGWVDAAALAFRQSVCIAGAIFALAVSFKDPGLSRLFLGCYLVTGMIVLTVINRFQPRLLTSLLFAHQSRLPTLMIGRAELFPQIDAWIAAQKNLGLEPVGLLTYRGETPSLPGLPVVGDFAALPEAIAATKARQVLMLSLPLSSADADHLVKACVGAGCRLLIHNNVAFELSHPLRALLHDGYSFLTFHDEPLEDPLNRCLKRTFDIALAVPVILLILPPLLFLTWLVQRFQSPGPVFYRQKRSGRGGTSFDIYKLRTMHSNGGAEGKQATRGDVRIYTFGSFLRRSSLDELPQFINVLAGEMSVVGPRPHFVKHDDLFAEAVDVYRIRFFVKPGITGLAQSRGYRGETRTREEIDRRVQLDLLYVRNWSLWLDCAIIGRTIGQVLFPPQMAQ